MSARLRTALRVLLPLLGLLLLGWWFWPRGDGPQSERALVQAAVRALARGSVEPLVAGHPTEVDLDFATHQAYMETLGVDRTLRWLAERRTAASPRPVPEPADAFASAWAAASPALAGTAGLVLDHELRRRERGTAGFRDLVFTVHAGGTGHVFRLGACLLTPRGWVTVEGLMYEGPVHDGPGALFPAPPTPGSIVHTFRCDPILPWANRAEIVEEIRRRLAWSPFPDAQVRVPAVGRIEVILPPGRAEDSSALPDYVTGRNAFALAIEVLPDEEYEPPLEERPIPPKRSGLWPGSAKAFHGWKAIEVTRWKEAQEAGRRYEPSQAAFRLVPRYGTRPRNPEDFLVIEHVGHASGVIGSRAFFQAKLQTGSLGELEIALVPTHIENMRVFQYLERNTGLPLVPVVGGVAHARTEILGGAWNAPVVWRYPRGTSVDDVQTIVKRIESGLGLPPMTYDLTYVGAQRK